MRQPICIYYTKGIALRDVVDGVLVHQGTIPSVIKQHGIRIEPVLSGQRNIIGGDAGTFVHAAKKEPGTEKQRDKHTISFHLLVNFRPQKYKIIRITLAKQAFYFLLKKQSRMFHFFVYLPRFSNKQNNINKFNFKKIYEQRELRL